MKRYVVCFIMDSKKEKVLMLLRKKQPYQNCFNGLGGKIEEGETKDESLFREIYEESNYNYYDFKTYKFLTSLSFPTDIELNAYYLILNEGKEYNVKNGTQTEEGILEWIDIKNSGVLDVTNKKFAGEGNISYFLNYALILENN